ncbi:hypothetical protein JCM33374_g80 [Metschnikowia sp. JCM 33374]|nr:hypothetical protein JCM33374_g80 [Metschnikowia sp. JCM 33374]
MKFTLASAALIASAVAASSDSVSYEIETVTNKHTTDITITSCADQQCVTTVQAVTNTVVTATVDGVETVYTTICPLTESATDASSSATSSVAAVPVSSSASAAPVTSSVAAVPASSSSSSSTTYTDITTTPVVTTSVGKKSTVYQQSTFTSVYNSTTSSRASIVVANNAPRNLCVGAAGVAGVAALLL